MKFNPLFIVALISLLLTGATGLWLIQNDTKISTESAATEPDYQAQTSSKPAPILASNEQNQTINLNPRPTLANDANSADAIRRFRESLANKKFQNAIQIVSDNYSTLSSSELDQLKSLYIVAVDKLAEEQNPLRLNALLAASELFNTDEIWIRISNTATNLQNWEVALQAQLALFQLQSDPQDIAVSLRAMLTSSSELRAIYQGRSDELSIKDMYERILRVTANAPRFQLELAYSHLRLNEEFEARALLEQLVYDPEIGNIAQTALDQLNQSTAVVQAKPKTTTPRRTNGIVVPLEAHGTSFIVNTRIERQNTRLLLDTGASITALSSALIDRLNLQPLNRQIRLNTANGSTVANLYRVERLQLGRLVLNDIVVADIDLGNANSFQGLLGTDALNKLRNDYDYVIDNGRKSLIFRPK